MHIYIVTTTLDESHQHIKRLFASLCKQKLRIFVVYIEQTRSALDLTQFDLDISRIRLDTPVSLSEARNIGISTIRQTMALIAFPDDDCSYCDDTITKCIEFISLNNAEKKDMIVISAHLAYDQMTLCSTPSTLKLFIGSGFKSVLISNSNTLFFYCCPSLLVFNEKMGVGTYFGSGEESDLLIRMYLRGISSYYVDSVKIFHPPFDSYSQVSFRKAFHYSLGHAYLLSKHQKYLRPFSNIFIYFKSFIGLLLALLSFNLDMIRVRLAKFMAYSRFLFLSKESKI